MQHINWYDIVAISDSNNNDVNSIIGMIPFTLANVLHLFKIKVLETIPVKSTC